MFLAPFLSEDLGAPTLRLGLQVMCLCAVYSIFKVLRGLLFCPLYWIAEKNIENYPLFEKNKIAQIMSQLRHHLINMDEIDKICKQINEHERFIAYGSPTLLNLLFDFQVDMKIFDKTVLLSSVNNGKILVPKNNDLIGLFTATGRLLGCCDAKFQEVVLDTKNTKILFSKSQINSEYIDFSFSMDTDNDYYEMHYVFLFLFDLIKTRYYELYIKE